MDVEAAIVLAIVLTTLDENPISTRLQDFCVGIITSSNQGLPSLPCARIHPFEVIVKVVVC
jgi:hypothetical protein